MPLLSTRWELHDVQDVEGLCVLVIQRSGLKLGHHDREDLLAYLLSTAWQLSVGFDPARTGRNFSGFALYVLRRRVTDWQRSKYRTRWVSKGRVYERPHVELVSLDDADDDRLGSSLAAGRLDGAELGFADELRALRTRARRPGGRDDCLGDEAA